MARGINKVILVGNVGQEPDVKYTQSGTAITTISLATSEKWKDKEGNDQERTEWHRVKFFGRLAEIAGEYIEKGRQIYVEGKLQTDKYDKDGVTHYSTNIIANEMQLLGGNPNGGDRREGHGGGEKQAEREPAKQQAAPQSQGRQSKGEDRGEPQRGQDRPSGPAGGNRYANAGGVKERVEAARNAGAQDRPPQQQGYDDEDDIIPF